MPFHMAEQKVLIAVAPNGARRSRKDHPALPVTPDEIAETAAACAQAGAAMIHLHIRDERGEHSLDPVRYRQAITAVRKRVGDNMLIQVSSEAAGRFTVHEHDEKMKDAKIIQKIDNGIDAQKRSVEIGADQWKAIFQGLSEKGCLLPKEVGILKIAQQIPYKIPTEKQSMVLMDVLDKARDEGLYA